MINPDPPGWAPAALGAGNSQKRTPEIVGRQPTEQSVPLLSRGNQDRDRSIATSARRGPIARSGGQR